MGCTLASPLGRLRPCERCFRSPVGVFNLTTALKFGRRSPTFVIWPRSMTLLSRPVNRSSNMGESNVPLSNVLRKGNSVPSGFERSIVHRFQSPVALDLASSHQGRSKNGNTFKLTKWLSSFSVPSCSSHDLPVWMTKA